jgi:hypothetical protein
VAIVMARSVPAASPVNSAPSRALATSVAGMEAAIRSAAEAPPPRWSGGVLNAGTRDRSVAYELPANNEVSMWTKRVRPVLCVRCVEGSTEVFVFTDAAAAFEGEARVHTVLIGFDDAPAVPERWYASEGYDALFSPEAIPLARRIAAARRFTFGFTPYNASPVQVQFDVSGFDALAAHIARECRWRP